MAINDVFNLNNALSSQSYAYKCWYDYKYCGNTMGIPDQYMNQLIANWGEATIAHWTTIAEKDDNRYEISDDDFNNAKNSGFSQTSDRVEDNTGFDGSMTGAKVNAGVDAAGAGASAAAGVLASKVVTRMVTKTVAKGVAKQAAKQAAKRAILQNGLNAMKQAAQESLAKATGKAAEKTAEKAAEKAAEKTVEQMTKTAGENMSKLGQDITTNNVSKGIGKSVGCIIGCTMVAAEAAKYLLKKPNKQETDACEELKNVMDDNEKEIGSAETEMAAARGNTEAKAEEVEENTENANEIIEKNKSDYDANKARFDELVARRDAGETLTDEEKTELEFLSTLMTENNENINKASEDAQTFKEDAIGEMEVFQDDFDDSAEKIATVEGSTNYAEGVDKSTQMLCYLEAGIQTLNAAFGAKSSYEAFALAASGSWAFGATAWAYGFGIMGAAGSATCAAGAVEQLSMANSIGKEIDMRESVQTLNTNAMDKYDESIDIYTGQVDLTTETTPEVPKDKADMDEFIEGLDGILGGGEETEGANGETGVNGVDSTSGNNPENPEIKKEPEEVVIF